VVFSQREKPRNLASFDYKKLHWGFTVGLNSLDFAINRNPQADNYVYADVIGFQPAGFQVNIVSDLRLSDYWNLRFLPGINLGSRDFYFFDPVQVKRIENPSPIPLGDDLDEKITVGSSFLDFPLLLKYRSERVNNYRPYVIGGLSYRLDMSASTDYNSEDIDLFLLKKSDFYIELGFGIDNYLQYFKFAPEIKLAIGLRNVMVTDNPKPNYENFANSIAGLRSFIVMLNFHFE
jgi:hypothetical protein